MILIAAIFGTLAKPELTVALLGLSAVFVFGIYSVLRRQFSSPPAPDPWDAEINLELAEDQGTPLCHHCLTPHHPDVDFCSHCGAAVGTYTNLLPFPYLFSIGQVLRIGTGEPFRKSPLTILGFMLVGIAQYTIFAPVYWFKLLMHLRLPPLAGGSDPSVSSQPDHAA